MHLAYPVFCCKGTNDALFLARRVLESKANAGDDNLFIIALDWAKAFDRIAPDALFETFRRFGIPPEFVQMIQVIY